MLVKRNRDGCIRSSNRHLEFGIFSAFAWKHRRTKRTCVEMADRRNFRINTLRISSDPVNKGGVDWSGDIAICVHKRSCRCRWAAASFFDRFSPKETASYTDKRRCWTFPAFGEEENLSPPPGIEPQFLGQPAVSLVPLLAELSRSLYYIYISENMTIFKGACMTSGRYISEKIWWFSKVRVSLVDETLEKYFWTFYSVRVMNTDVKMWVSFSYLCLRWNVLGVRVEDPGHLFVLCGLFSAVSLFQTM